MRAYLFPQLKRLSESIGKTDTLRTRLCAIKDEAENDVGADIPVLTFSDFVTVYRTGSRKEYERSYFKRRKRLCSFAVLSAVYEENEAYFKELQDTVWAILDEFTWALPAHIFDTGDTDGMAEVIDLFAAETAADLCEIAILFESRFDPLIQMRLDRELKRRIIRPFLQKEYHWESMKNNWSAVCGGSVGRCFLYAAEEDEIQVVLPRLQRIMEVYLSGFGDDGACAEGLDYWDFGFGHYSYFAEALFLYTNGKTDYFYNDKVHSIALFPQRISFGNGRSVNFSDCTDSFFPRRGLSALLSAKFPDFRVEDTPWNESSLSFSALIRDFVLPLDRTLGDGTPRYGALFFEDVGWYIRKSRRCHFAVKAGNNEESHNHIDIGSFILMCDGKNVIIDAGKGEYTADYFSEKRYTCFPPSGAAHSIPVIGGKTQGIGCRYTGKIVSTGENEVVVDLKNAYDAPLSEFYRKFTFSDREIEMRDYIRFTEDAKSVTEHFVTEYPPRLSEREILVGEVRITIPPGSRSTVSEKTFPSGYDRSKSVWLIDIEIAENTNELMFHFHI